MAEAKRKPGRPRKHVGLSPAGLKKVVDGSDLRDLRASDAGSEGTVLPDASAGDTSSPGEGRVFAAARNYNGVRGATPQPPPISDALGRDDESADIKFTQILKSVAMELAAPKYQDRDTQMTNLEALARRVFNEALSSNMGSQRAREMIVERLEGKAVRGEKPVSPNNELLDQLDRAEAEFLNSLVKGPEDAVSERQDSPGADHEHGD